MNFEPLQTSAREVDFGVDAGALDLPHLSDSDFAALERAVLTHEVVVVRGQQALSPRNQFELTRRFDPTVRTYGHGNRAEVLKQSVLVQDLVSNPGLAAGEAPRQRAGSRPRGARRGGASPPLAPLVPRRAADRRRRGAGLHSLLSLAHRRRIVRAPSAQGDDSSRPHRARAAYPDGALRRRQRRHAGGTARHHRLRLRGDRLRVAHAGAASVGPEDPGAVRAASLRMDEARPRPNERPRSPLRRSRARAWRAAAVRAREDHDVAARLGEPADGAALAAAPRVLRRGPRRRRRPESETSPSAAAFSTT